MDRRSRTPPTRSDLYSTVVIHNNSDSDEEKRPPEGDDIYATMVYKNDASEKEGQEEEEEEEEDDSALPPLLKRLPKDFGGGASIDYDNDPDGGAEDFGTMIVKTGRNRNSKASSSSHSSYSSPLPASVKRRDLDYSDFHNSSLKKRIETFEDDDEDGNGDDFSTFVVKTNDRESVSGTVVRRTGGGSGGGGEGGSFKDSTMGRAVASMQAVGEGGFGGEQQRKRSGSSSSQGDEGARLASKISISSMPESITREDPTTKYDLLSELGKGSYGAVYKARDRRTSELVAIKVISLCEGEEGYEEIRGEIEMLQQCNHPNVVRYLGSYQGEEYLWIVMEYCGGGSVADLMNVSEKPLEEYQIAYICREALKGLSYLHSIFKVHRDIKGGNILLTEQGEVKLGDFGVAAQLTRTMSKRNTFIGTPHWMAPEVIQENRYDGKVDVWALGVSAIEMAEGLPPRASVHPMRVLFMISIEPAPMLEDKEKWSLVFHDFVAKCLTKEPRLRPTASEMLKHKFIEKCQCGASAMLPKLEEARKMRASMELAQSVAPILSVDGVPEGPQFNEDYGDTVPSKPQIVGPKVTNEILASGTIKKQPALGSLEETKEGDFGTVIVHDGEKIDKTVSSTETLNAIQSPALSHVDSPSLLQDGSKSAHFRVDGSVGVAVNSTSVGELHQNAHGLEAASLLFGSPEQNLKMAESQTQVGSGNDVNNSLLKNETFSKKAFALQDKLWSIYAAGNTVPIPFLRATDISPIALLSDNVLGSAQRDNSGSITTETLQELFAGDGQMKKGRRGQNEMPLPPSVYRRLTSSSTLLNLAQALAYHKMCHEEMPLQELQAVQAQQTIQNLSDTLRTILRL
ncbi:STE20-like serine/threonine-protein kinase isoform X1 [Eucalyptus grandis]|uniref:STE20-like serine/threonine-protein kinase isoform X1 n=1 Tax=Eucalyptus grandis TaxID=71139 RepID=UPI00192ED98A|nr:STE20-like serine/threonine-protein kinase isoform X1 [Eucalyptus grandis]